MNIRGKKISVVGLGVSGLAVSKFLIKKKAWVRVTDRSKQRSIEDNARHLAGLGAEVETGGHTESFIKGSSLVVVSPGVPEQSPPNLWAKKHKIPIISEIELASMFCRGTVVGVTGSNGKTTTSHLIYKLLKDARRDSVLCGNIGCAFVEHLARICKKTVVVLELSSFQLEACPTFRPRIAVVLNLAPNHLDRHKSFREYVAAKERIFKNQKKNDFLVLNYDDPTVRRMASKSKSNILYFSQNSLPNGLCLKQGCIVLMRRGREIWRMDIRSCHLVGMHNYLNMMAAAAVGDLLKIPLKVMERTLIRFKTLEHRIEPMGQINGIRFLNDSKSTTVESTRAAIMSISGPVVLVAGGRDKEIDFGSIEPLIQARVRRAILYGEAGPKIRKAWRNFSACEIVKEFEDAVWMAFRHAQQGDSLLLSPMCTSFDQFNSYEERGEKFKEIYHQITTKIR